MSSGTKKNHIHKKNNRKAAKIQSSSQDEGSFRIIGGNWRSRRLQFPVIEGLRPTTDRVKETVFNWLSIQVPNARVLDLFAGSGSLGFEALSRGASFLTAIEQNPQAATAIKSNLNLLLAPQSLGQAEVIQVDALKWLKTFSKDTATHSMGPCYDLIFLDPPFRKDLLSETLEMLTSSKILAPNALIYLEKEKEAFSLVPPSQWQLLKEKMAGQVCYQLFQNTLTT